MQSQADASDQGGGQEPMICVNSLTKCFNSIPVLEQVSFEIPDGSVFGLLGPNGAGKTTLIRLIMGFLLPDSGSVNLGNLNPAQIGYLPERAFYPGRFTIRSYLNTMGRLAGLEGSRLSTQTDQLLHKVNLHNARHQRLGDCSRGMLQRLGLAQALLADPPVILLDEPARALDPAGQQFMRQQIALLHETGTTVVLSTHHLDEVARVCTHIGVLSKGRLVRLGLLDSILAPRARVTITVGPMPTHLPAQIASLAPDIAVTDGQVVLNGESVASKAEVLRLLVESEVDIRRLTEQVATLEEVYLEATGA